MIGIDLPVAARAARTGVTVWGKLWAAVARKRDELTRANAFREALGVAQAEIYNYRLATNHPLYPVGTPHPDDLEAFAAILGTDAKCWDQAVQWAAEGENTGQLSEGFVLIGSPEAEAITRLVFGYESRGAGRGMRHIGVGIPFPFRWEEDDSLVKASYKKYVPERGLVERRNWPVLDQRGDSIRSIFPRLDNKGMLTSDLLLISKIPNFLTVDSFQSGRSIVSVAGTHGVGTRAIELLLRNRKLMAQIESDIGRSQQYFQVLLEVGNVKHDKKNGSRARRIDVRAVAPLDLPDRLWSSARREAEIRMPKWSQEVSSH